VADAARRLGLPLEEIETTRDDRFLEHLRDVVPDLSVVVAYGELLSSEVLRVPRLGSLNLHFSLLPRWRGASPVQHAILEGDPVTGVSVMLMDEGLDTGPVLARAAEPIQPQDDAGSLGGRLATMGAEMVLQVVQALAGGTVDADISPIQQVGSPTSAPMLARGDREIDWRQPADAIVRRVRALAPETGATTTWRRKDLKVLRAALGGSAEGEPGTIVKIDREGVTVASGEGSVRVLQLAAAGRRRMPATDWARGARDLLGERLG